MKKILLSAAVIIPVLALVIGGTIAFYNDTETSTGNIFVAGSIDLKVDHLKQTYNGADCKTCSVTVVSDTSNKVVSTVNGNDPTPLPHAALLVNPINPSWPWVTIPGASWIWATAVTTNHDAQNQVSYTFQKKFDWFNPAIDAIINLSMAADNGYAVVFNGYSICSNSGEFNYNHVITCPITAGQINTAGQNTLEITITNKAIAGSTGAGNPGGLIYSLTINGDCTGNNDFQNNCKLWSGKDLGNGDTFFNFGDVKPGDHGTNVISLHVDNNEAYACLLPINKHDNENVCNEAETEALDPTCTVPNVNGEGELGTQIKVVTWNDVNQDGVHQSGEAILGQGSIKDLLAGKFTIPMGQTKYLGLAWCAGTIPAMNDTSGNVVCNASGMNNKAQTDSFQADLELYAVQTRNNTGFSCASIPPQ